MAEETRVKFLEKSLEAIHQQRVSYDNKANFLLGVAGVLFVLSVANFKETAYLIIAIFSLIAAIFCVYSISMPYRRFVKGESQSIFCWWGIKGIKYQDYLKKIKESINSEEDLVREYSQEIYSLYKKSIRYKALLLKLAGFSLLIGFVVELIYLIILARI